MVVLFYAGWGLLVFVFGIVGFATALFLMQTVNLAHVAVPYVGCGIAAALCWIFGRWVNSSAKDKTLVDTSTNELVVLRSRHSLLFIQIEYWALIILALAGFWFYQDVQSGEIDLQHLETMFDRSVSGSTKPVSQGSVDAIKQSTEKDSVPNTAAPQLTRFAYRPDKINVVFNGAVPEQFENGRATSCVLTANIHNNTKYHLTNLSFKFANWNFTIDGEMNANTYIDDYPISTIALRNESICWVQAAYIQKHIAEAGVFDCVMPNIAEGDCQSMVVISSWIDDAAVKRINDAETALGAKQIAPLRQAIEKAGLAGGNIGPVTPEKLAKFSKLLDTFVLIDSQSWYHNKYTPGSMINPAVIAQSSDGSSVTIRGAYTYREREAAMLLAGWVEATIKNGALSCLRFHDFKDDCRPIHLPDVAAAQK